MPDSAITTVVNERIARARAKALFIELIRVPSPQTELLEEEPLLKAFIKSAIEPRLREMGFADVNYDAMGKGASEQKSNLSAMLHALEVAIASGRPITGELIFVCCVSGETGKHDAIKSVIEGMDVHADMALLYGNSLKITLGNRGRIDVFVTVNGAPCHSSRPGDGANAITGAMEAILRLTSEIKLARTHPQLAFEEIRRVAKSVEQYRDPVSGKQFIVEVRLGPFMYPSLVTEDSPVVQAIQQASVAMPGHPAETYYAAAAFDQGYLNHMGIPTANYGPGEQQLAHTDNHLASVERTTDAAKVYACMALAHLT